MKEYTIYYTDTLHAELYGAFETYLKCYNDKQFIETWNDLQNDVHCANIYAVSSDGTFPQEWEKLQRRM